MIHLGQFLKSEIEKRGLIKADLAEKLNISRNYLSDIFHKETMDMRLWVRLCNLLELDPRVAFSDQPQAPINYQDINATAVLGHASVNIGNLETVYRELIVEKERTIQILLDQLSTKSRQNCDSNQ